MTPAHVTIADRQGWTSVRDGERVCWFAGYLLDPPVRGEAACRHVLRTVAGEASVEDATQAVATLNGHFAFVLQAPRGTVAAVDRTRSTPLFFGELDGTVHVDPWAVRLRERLGLSTQHADLTGALTVAMSGYTSGHRTLYRGLRQLRPGELLLVPSDGPAETHRYYVYRPWNADTRPRGDLVEELTAVTRRLFEDLASVADGRTILVPLSGGLDSRLVVAGLREVGFDDIHCFAYGLPGNFEAAISEEVARRLEVPWFFIPVTHRMMRAAIRDTEHERYLRWTDSCASVPVEHEYLAVAELRRRGWDRDRAIIVNGQSGDFITGGHVPRGLVGGREGLSPGERRQSIVDALIRKHYGLWEALQTADNLEEIGRHLWDDIAKDAVLPADPGRDYGLYEMSEWQNRQSRYIVTNQRVYEYFGFEWALPLWDPAYLDFWETVPPEQKLGQALYRRMLETTDWGGVWRSVADRQYVSPRWLRAVRPALKAAVGAVSGRRGWKAFERRYLEYWMDIQGKSAAVPYGTAVRDRRGARHAVSWLTEAYLARHGLDWRGRPLEQD